MCNREFVKLNFKKKPNTGKSRIHKDTQTQTKKKYDDSKIDFNTLLSLDVSIKKYERKKDLILKCLKYKRSNEDKKINDLIIKWKTISQMAISYLFNLFMIRVQTYGGIDEWLEINKKKENKKNESLILEIEEKYEEFTNSNDFQFLSEMEKKEIFLEFEDQKKKINNSMIDKNDRHVEKKYSIEDFCKHLNLDYYTIFDE